MISLYRLELDPRYEPNLIKELAGIDRPWGSPVLEGKLILTFSPDKLDDVMAAVDAYDAEALARAKRDRLGELAALRWEKTQSFTYDGVRTAADPAIGVITGKLKLREVAGVPAIATDKWKLADNEFRSWDEPAIIQFGIAVGMHIQACFDHEENLTNQIMAATAVDQVEQVDIGTGWPG